MGLTKKFVAIITALAAVSVTGCNKEPLLTNLETKKLIVVLKGTYESNSPMPWSMPALCDPAHLDPATGKCTQYSNEYLTRMQDESVYECASTDDRLPSTFMLDVAEIRLYDTRGKQYKYANYRQTLASSLNDVDPLFNGIGYPLNNDDVPSKAYPFVLVYVRKMLMDGAQSYVSRSTGWASSPVWDVYNEGEYPTYNFNGIQIHSFYDTLRIESSSTNRVYPMVIPINDMLTGGAGMLYSGKFSATVLEIRFMVKNYIKKYEMRTSSLLTEYGVTHFYALSDWLNDVQKGDTVVGGNLLAIARSYVPELVGRISGTVPVTAAVPGIHVIAIPAGGNIKSYTLNVDPFTDITVATPKTPADGTLRSLNPCNLPKAPSQYTGTSIYQALDFFLDSENYKYDWNKKIPGTANVCHDYSAFSYQWDLYAGEANSYTLPQLAVYVPTQDAAGSPTNRQFAIENVMPGSYDIYYASRAPVYGTLYYDGEYLFGGTVTVSPGSNSTLAIP